MSRTPARFTQADVARAIRAVEQTGARMAVEIDPSGTIRIIPYEPPPAPANSSAPRGRRLEQERRPIL
jgi:hypothetical protein